MYQLEDYNYDLPESLIAQKPVERRDQSRLLHLSRSNGAIAHKRFSDTADLLKSGDVLVVNNTRVIPGRLLGRKESGGKVEALILDYAQGMAERRFTCLVKASKRPKTGSLLFFDEGLSARVAAVAERTCTLVFESDANFEQLLEKIGHVPLPPYIRRDDEASDHLTYQTVYAASKGAIAAPTAGLHFTRELLDRLTAKGVHIAQLTLHVGYGTFLPVQHDDIRQHRMHAEWFTISPEAARTVNDAKSDGRRVIAVGTTCVRTLEFNARTDGRLTAGSGMCDLFIYPGYTFRLIDGMITNFHLPKSTLIMLVSAFAGRENVLRAYAEAVAKEYRFYSYGDGMVII